MIARAEYQAWVNIVQSVELEIHYEFEPKPEPGVEKTRIKIVATIFWYDPLHSATTFDYF